MSNIRPNSNAQVDTVCGADGDSKIAMQVATRFPGRAAREHYGELLNGLLGSGLAPPHMVQEVASGEDGKFWACVWESMLFRHLTDRGFEFRRGHVKKSGQLGPDFGIVHGDRTIWIEAVVPAPDGIPPEYLEPPPPGESHGVPYDQMLLRLLSALKDKCDKLSKYVQDGIIAPTDSTIIALNACRLSWHSVHDTGLSQLPLILEAVFPIGPYAVPVGCEGDLDGDPVRLPRYTIRKPNNAEVPKTAFLDPRYAHISAVMSGFQRHMIDSALSLTLVHNPLASRKLPRELFGARAEYVAEEQGDKYLVHPLGPSGA